MFSRIQTFYRYYPGQFWLLFWGFMLSTIGTSMIWPFMMIYISETLDQPLTTAATLLTLNAIMSLISSMLAGPLSDRIGRKWLMTFSLLLHGASFIGLAFAQTYWSIAVLIAISGFVSPVYRVGTDAMVADLLPEEKRVEAYAFMRMGHNVGVAIGPTIGGFIAVASYNNAFFIAAFGLAVFSILIAFFAKETRPEIQSDEEENKTNSGYGPVLRDKTFMTMSIAYTINTIAASLVFVLLAVYVKENYGIPENQYGFIMATNAVMVILFQVLVTKLTRKLPAYLLMGIGAVIYSLAIGSFAIGTVFLAFLASMIVMTIGEMMLVPSTTTMTANLSPPEMRGRYMSINGLAWGIASGIGPVFGGFLNDNVEPVAIWYGGAVIGIISALLFGYLAWKHPKARLVKEKTIENNSQEISI